MESATMRPSTLSPALFAVRNALASNTPETLAASGATAVRYVDTNWLTALSAANTGNSVCNGSLVLPVVIASPCTMICRADLAVTLREAVFTLSCTSVSSVP